MSKQIKIYKKDIGKIEQGDCLTKIYRRTLRKSKVGDTEIIGIAINDIKSAYVTEGDIFLCPGKLNIPKAVYVSKGE